MNDMPAELPHIPELSFDDIPSIPFELIREKLDDLLEAMYNLLDREWPERLADKPELRVLLMGTVKITQNTYKSIRFLCADKPEDPARKIEFAVSVPPMSRTILDSIFTFVYMFDDLDARLAWFHKSGWREVQEEAERYRAEYGDDQNWTEYLGWQQAFVSSLGESAGVTAEQAQNPRSIQWWPNPGRMKNDPNLSEERRSFLAYLNDWYYRELSADSHLSLPGLMRRAGHFLQPDVNKRENLLKKYKSDCVVTTIVLILALLSEVDLEFRFRRNVRLKEVWTTLASISMEAKEIYDLRYADSL